ncbi:MAG: BLUF domain-containing protein [Xanthomonadales bacterium]|nr:BLUF domain-containing protein [Gammaproteobacteria bacterium]NND58219.1 BLUF domain-containing protein [Xanthomonadales bacterium]
MYRLIYKSKCKGTVDWRLVDQIIGSSEAHNQNDRVTGVLLATKSHFLQVIEGGFEEINDLFLRIARDPRHEEVQLVGFTCVESRLFGGWAMHGIGIFDFNEDLSAALISKWGEESGGVRFPVQEWQALALINDIRSSGPE